MPKRVNNTKIKDRDNEISGENYLSSTKKTEI